MTTANAAPRAVPATRSTGTLAVVEAHDTTEVYSATCFLRGAKALVRTYRQAEQKTTCLFPDETLLSSVEHLLDESITLGDLAHQGTDTPFREKECGDGIGALERLKLLLKALQKLLDVTEAVDQSEDLLAANWLLRAAAEETEKAYGSTIAWFDASRRTVGA